MPPMRWPRSRSAMSWSMPIADQRERAERRRSCRRQSGQGDLRWIVPTLLGGLAQQGEHAGIERHLSLAVAGGWGPAVGGEDDVGLDLLVVLCAGHYPR